MPHVITLPAPAIPAAESSPSTSTAAAEAFVDEIIEDKDINSTPNSYASSTANKPLTHNCRIDQFGVLCAWLFLIQTIVQLLAELFVSKEVNRIINIIFNADYCLLYIVFLVLYATMPSNQRPRKLYIAGVVLYAIGYMCFCLLFSLTTVNNSLLVALWLYISGSVLFLVGSVGIVLGAIPKSASVSDGLYHLHALLPHNIEAGYFWGGLCFGIGSIIFCWDAIPLSALIAQYDSDFAAHYDMNMSVVIGLCLFVVGRCFFLYGSQTKYCNVLLCGETAIKVMPMAIAKDKAKYKGIPNYEF